MDQQTIATVVTSGVSVFVALCSFAVAWFKSKEAKARADEIENKYSEALLNGAYLICPKCGAKIMLKDIEWLFEKSQEKEKK